MTACSVLFRVPREATGLPEILAGFGAKTSGSIEKDCLVKADVEDEEPESRLLGLCGALDGIEADYLGVSPPFTDAFGHPREGCVLAKLEGRLFRCLFMEGIPSLDERTLAAAGMPEEMIAGARLRLNIEREAPLAAAPAKR